jgi:hypothetical protein
MYFSSKRAESRTFNSSSLFMSTASSPATAEQSGTGVVVVDVVCEDSDVVLLVSDVEVAVCVQVKVLVRVEVLVSVVEWGDEVVVEVTVVLVRVRVLVSVLDSVRVIGHLSRQTKQSSQSVSLWLDSVVELVPLVETVMVLVAE